MISWRASRLGEPEVDRAVEAAGSHEGRVEVGGPVGGGDHQDVGAFGPGLVQRGGPRPEAFTSSISAPRSRWPGVGSSKDWSWTSSSLTTPATPSELARPPTPWRAAPMASNSSMKPMAPPSAGGRAGAAPGSRRGSCGPSGRSTSTGRPRPTRTGTGRRPLWPWPWPRRSSPCPAAPRRAPRGGGAPHTFGEGLVAEEQVDGPHHLAPDGIDPHHVIQPDADLARSVQHVGRSPRPEQRPGHHDGHHHHEAQGREVGH